MIKMKTITTLTAVLAVLTAGNMAYAGGDAEKGAKVFKKCKACHKIGEGAKNSLGPVLTGVVGRPIASYEGYNYSSGMKTFAEGGAVWEEANLATFLADPKGTVPKTKMTYKGLKKETDIADVIAYLASVQ